MSERNSNQRQMIKGSKTLSGAPPIPDKKYIRNRSQVVVKLTQLEKCRRTQISELKVETTFRKVMMRRCIWYFLCLQRSLMNWIRKLRWGKSSTHANNSWGTWGSKISQCLFKDGHTDTLLADWTLDIFSSDIIDLKYNIVIDRYIYIYYYYYV